MGAAVREAKRRIRSTQSTKKITRAFELIAASRALKAQQRVQASRPYSNAITAALSAASSDAGELVSDFLQERAELRNAAVIVVTSDRGLAGAYSANVLRQAEELIARLQKDGVEPKLYTTGRKAGAYFRFRQRPVVESWAGFSDGPSYNDAKVVADVAMTAFKNGDVDEIYVVYTDFVSAFTQRAEARRLLPLEVVEGESAEADTIPMYEYEPDPVTVLDQLLTRYIEVRIYNVFLEAAASELAARRRAMSTATENATELIEQYTRQYNRARQQEITQELMEIVGAAEAFKGSRKS